MKKIIIVLHLIGGSLLFGCSSSNSQKNSETPKDSIPPKTEETETKKEVPEKSQKPDADTPEAISQKLQGKWRSLDDAKSIVEFSGEFRLDIYEKEQLTKEKFSIAKACPESENPNLKSDKFEYIVAEDMCWSIDTLDDKNLILMYTARGNILRYEKIK
ncbi:MAG: hypothetical protein MUE85_06850 [Microscillaceae bacterium]|jgi:hypothetical protein|nr:hypothetical protein [Microscillaceae bacterium]